MQQASERLIRSAPNRLELDLKLASETTQAYAKAALAELAREFYETADKVERRAKILQGIPAYAVRRMYLKRMSSRNPNEWEDFEFPRIRKANSIWPID
jgi:hypothetical protein